MGGGRIKNYDDIRLNESETRRFSFELVYPLCFLEYNCTAYPYIDNHWRTPTRGSLNALLTSSRHLLLRLFGANNIA